MSGLEDRCLALAGVYQAAAEVRRIGREGAVGTAALEATIESLFRFDAPTVADVYGGEYRVVTGLRSLRNFLNQTRDRAALEIARYAGALLRLERKASSAGGPLDGIRDGLESIVAQGLQHPPYEAEALRRIADIYVDHVSPIGPRIMVQGEPAFLNAEGNPEKIRALLLGGLRSAVLWRQLGGTRLGLVFSRTRQVEAATALLNRSQAELESDR